MSDVLGMLKNALAVHQSGDLDGAEALYKSVLKAQKNQPDAVHLLGVLKRQQGALEDAKHYAEQAISLRPHMAEAWGSLALTEFARGEIEKAETAFKKAVDVAKTTPKVHVDLVQFYQKINNLKAAREASERFLKHCPKAQEAWFWHSQMLAASGELQAASVVASQAVDVLPQSADVFYNLGLILLKSGDFSGARTATTQALNLSPQHPHLLMQMGMVEMGQRAYKDAIDWLKLASEHKVVALAAYTALAEVYEKLNDPESAAEACEKGLALAPEAPVLLYVKAIIARRNKQLEDARALLEKVLSQDIPPQHKVMVLFEYGRVLDRLGQYAHAYQTLCEANALYAELSPGIAQKKESYLKEIERLRTALKGYTNHAQADVPHAPLVFLIGAPRSGTTLLDQILDAHSAVDVMEEQDCVSAMLSHPLEGGRTVEKDYDNLTRADIQILQDVYFQHVQDVTTHHVAHTLVDKYPLNLTKAIYLRKIFPQAKFIFAARHPFDVALSNFMQSFEMNAAMANFLTIEDAVHLYDQILTLWEEAQKVAEFNVHLVRYEDVVSDMENQARALIHFMGKEWEEGILSYRERAKTQKVIQTPSYSQVVEPLYNRAKGRYAHYADMFAPYTEKVAPHLSFLGYEGL